MRWIKEHKDIYCVKAVVISVIFLLTFGTARGQEKPGASLLNELKASGFRIIFASRGTTNQNGNSELYLCKADGSELVNITNTADYDERIPRVHWKSGRVAFIKATCASGTLKRDSRHGTLVFMGIDGKNLEETNVTGNDMSWHPDGTKLALQFVHGWPNWKNGFRIYDLQTKQLQIVGNQVGLLELDWSFDGKMLVCRQNYKIMVMNADGTNFRPFYAAPNPKECPYCHPCWHPLKLTVAWNSRQGLLVGDYNPSDGSATNVHSVVSFKDVGWEDPCPRWSPDGKYILWITQSKRLHVVRVSDQVFAELAIPREWRVEVWDYDWVAK